MDHQQQIDIYMYAGLGREVSTYTDDYEVDIEKEYEHTDKGYVPHTSYNISFSNTDLEKVIKEDSEIYTLPKLLKIAEDMARMLSDISEEPRYKKFYTDVAEQCSAWEVVEQDYTLA